MLRKPGSRPYHHGDLRAALLDGAERTLREKGAGSLSLRELARDIGVSHAAPGRHFKDKQALLHALALDGYERLTQALAGADDPALPIQLRLTALARAYVAFATANSALLELMFARRHGSDASDEILGLARRASEFFERVIVDAQERGEIIEGDPARLTLAVGAALHGTATFATQNTADPKAALDGIDDLVHLLLRGLQPR
ncbi:TetR/AcrR family transcriptional regulator [Streptomyces europaeiscabiei]|uniref:TetR/AcrR family transcriptional regulator n=1 Tax=Streptomyces europaeiscabiei TaxID=146819 RepID=UPI002E25E93E|nr:TetR/AcrR family transcriptional regulator [Streptomyces europaeiscabiei]